MRTLSVEIEKAALNQLMPMHLWVTASGQVRSVGTTLCKTFGSDVLEGGNFFDLFDVRRPSGMYTVKDLSRRAGERLQIMRKEPREVQGLRGIAVSLTGNAGVLINLSFGIGVVEAVAAYRLTDGDFVVTDLAMELLYLVEAKTAVTEELRQLNQRLQGARDAAQEQAFTDTLTGLRNRRALDVTMSTWIERQVPFGLMHIDLDYFKAVNDTLGHAAGDLVLREVAKTLRSETRTDDTVARVGGDEFVIIFRDLVDPEKLKRIADRVVEKLGEPSVFQNQLCRVSASIGISISTAYSQPNANKLLKDADEALYASKNAGRSQAQLFSPPQEKSEQASALEA